MSKDLLYLESIAEALERIRCYTQDGRASFLESTLHQDGVIRNLIVIGEAVKHLSADLRDSETAIPWKAMAGMRDVLIHDYLRVNLDQVWQTVDRDLPPLNMSIGSMIARVSAG